MTQLLLRSNSIVSARMDMLASRIYSYRGVVANHFSNHAVAWRQMAVPGFRWLAVQTQRPDRQADGDHYAFRFLDANGDAQRAQAEFTNRTNLISTNATELRPERAAGHATLGRVFPNYGRLQEVVENIAFVSKLSNACGMVDFSTSFISDLWISRKFWNIWNTVNVTLWTGSTAIAIIYLHRNWPSKA